MFNPQELPSEIMSKNSANSVVWTLACAVLQEWASLWLVMHQEYYGTIGVSDKDTTDVLQVLSDSFSTLYPLLSKFAQITLVLPVSSTTQREDKYN